MIKAHIFITPASASLLSMIRSGLDHRFVQKGITTSLQDLEGFEYDYRWLKHTGYTHLIP